MGKSKKFGHKVNKPGALGDQILGDRIAKATSRTKGQTNDDPKKKAQNIAPALAQLKILQEEIVEQEFKESKITEKRKEPAKQEEEEEEDEDFEVPEHMDSYVTAFQTELDIRQNDEENKIFMAFMTKRDEETPKTCIQRMKENLDEQHYEIKTQLGEQQNDSGVPEFDENILSMLDEVASYLKNYRSGALPKMVKMMPLLRNWIHLLYRIKPDEWSAAAMYQMTHLFRSQKPEMAQVFYAKVLLPRLRDDIMQYKKLNTYLYRALAQSLFKCTAFFKGIILPLCYGNDCTLREAVIFGSLLAKKKIPILASSAAIKFISGMKYSGANSIFLRVLLNKKHALCWTVIDSVCEHFVRFKLEDRKLPVLWHQSLLTFVQRYKDDLSSDQKEQVQSLTAFHTHKAISLEIRRELEHSKNRGEK